MIRHIFFRRALLGEFGCDRFGCGGWNGLLRQTFRSAPAVRALTGGVTQPAFERLLIAAIGGAMVDFGRGGAAGLTTIDALLVAGGADKE